MFETKTAVHFRDMGFKGDRFIVGGNGKTDALVDGDAVLRIVFDRVAVISMVITIAVTCLFNFFIDQMMKVFKGGFLIDTVHK